MADHTNIRVSARTHNRLARIRVELDQADNRRHTLDEIVTLLAQNWLETARGPAALAARENIARSEGVTA